MRRVDELRWPTSGGAGVLIVLVFVLLACAPARAAELRCEAPDARLPEFAHACSRAAEQIGRQDAARQTGGLVFRVLAPAGSRTTVLKWQIEGAPGAPFTLAYSQAPFDQFAVITATAGAKILRLESQGVLETVLPVTLEAGKIVVVDGIRMVPVSARNSGSIDGVVHLEGDAPAGGLVVGLAPLGPVVLTDDSGRFRIETVGRGRKRLTVSTNGFDVAWTDLVVVAGQDTTARIEAFRRREVLIEWLYPLPPKGATEAATRGTAVLAPGWMDRIGFTPVFGYRDRGPDFVVHAKGGAVSVEAHAGKAGVLDLGARALEGLTAPDDGFGTQEIPLRVGSVYAVRITGGDRVGAFRVVEIRTVPPRSPTSKGREGPGDWHPFSIDKDVGPWHFRYVGDLNVSRERLRVHVREAELVGPPPELPTNVDFLAAELVVKTAAGTSRWFGRSNRVFVGARFEPGREPVSLRLEGLDFELPIVDTSELRGARLVIEMHYSGSGHQPASSDATVFDALVQAAR